ncbi:hypothetical protein D6C94_00893 [Aureobasidium pullulans]|uniref:Uncharacterized protein n=2 Tax=Aureobasidium pullulans TaxID=5580 RepID=A0AB38M8D6_AURPU|nr:hypothetical protein D6C94_00893 [Aureobasidium pullulans]
MSLRISIYALRLTIVVGRVVLWFTFTSGAVDVHISPDYVWLFAFAFMITLHTMYDATYVAACTANFGADARFDDAFHVFITLLDMQMARAIRLTVAGDHDEAVLPNMNEFTIFINMVINTLFEVIIPFLAQPLNGERTNEMSTSLSQIFDTSQNLTHMGNIVLAFVVTALATLIRPPFRAHARIYRPAVLLILCRFYYEAELGLLDHLVKPNHAVKN